MNASSTITGTQLVSKIATGTKPLSVTSTTLVDNLNADLLDGQHSTYYANATHVHSLTVGNGSVTQITYNTSDTLHIVGGTNVSVAYDDATNKVTISANDTSIAYSELTGRPNMWYNLTDGTTTATPDAESDTFTFAQGGGLTVAVDSTNDKVTYSHADTSTVANVSSDNTGLTFIQDLTLQFDTYGHVTNASVATASVTIPNNFGTVTVLDDPGTGYTWADNGSAIADSTSDTLSIVSGAGIVIDVDAATDALRFSHEDTSSAANLAASGRTYVTGLTFDTYGHVTAYTTGAETVTNTTYDLLAVANTVANEGILRLKDSGNANDDVKIVGSGATTISSNATHIIISSTDNNTDTLQSISDDTTTNATYYPSFVTATSGAQAAKVSSTKLTFNPSTGLLTASGLSGSTLTSTVATGTAPLTVTSTTAVTNLNADLLDGNHASAFAVSDHNHTYNVNDAWLRDNGDNATFKQYGNSRQMVFRTDGTTEYSTGVGASAFIWMYRGDAVDNKIGSMSSAGDFTLKGTLYAASKSFLIPHPTKESKKLRYGSLEGPENGVYIRGKLKGNVIELPEYWTKLVDPDSITVNLTPIGKHQDLFVEDIVDNTVIVGNGNLFSKEINCFYTVFAERVDIAKLEVEID